MRCSSWQPHPWPKLNNANYWNTTGPADWTSGNWTANNSFWIESGNFSQGGSVINNGGTVTITTGDNVTDATGNKSIYIGGGNTIGVTGGNGYVLQSGGLLAPTTSWPLQEQLGVGDSNYSGGTVYQGIYTQTGGTNFGIILIPSRRLSPTSFAALQVGYSNGGYGEYDLSGGFVGPNLITVGANEYQSNVSSLANAGTGVFNQTGGSVGAIGGVSGVTGGNQAVGLTVGGDWIYNPASILKTTGGTNWTSVGTYNLSDPNHNDLTGTGPLVVGGIEGVGVTAPALSTRAAEPTSSPVAGIWLRD